MKILTKENCETILSLATERLGNYIKEAGLKGFSLGISGGIDSSVVAVICLKTLEKLNKEEGREKYGYDFMFLDCDSDPVDFEKAKTLSKKFNFKLNYIDLTPWYNVSPLLETISESEKSSKIAKGNIKCRLRMISIYNSATLNNFIYPDTDDWSEEIMGFWTMHGDTGAVKIVQHITKTELYDLGEYLDIPEIILGSAPGDGLKVSEGNVASDQLGMEYFFIEYLMSKFVESSFDFNGSFDQLKNPKFIDLIKEVAEEIKKSEAAVLKVLEQSLKTAYKRKYGDNVCLLLESRKELGLVEFGTSEFSGKYLKIIKNLSNAS